jgi:hypothetical protein
MLIGKLYLESELYCLAAREIGQVSVIANVFMQIFTVMGISARLKNFASRNFWPITVEKIFRLRVARQSGAGEVRAGLGSTRVCQGERRTSCLGVFKCFATHAFRGRNCLEGAQNEHSPLVVINCVVYHCKMRLPLKS